MGTKKKYEERYSHPIPVRLPQVIHDKVQETVNTKHKKKSAVIVDALVYYFEHEEGTVRISEEEFQEYVDKRIIKLEEEIKEMKGFFRQLSELLNDKNLLK